MSVAIDIFTIVGRYGDTDTRRYAQLMVVYLEGFGERSEQVAGNASDLFNFS